MYSTRELAFSEAALREAATREIATRETALPEAALKSVTDAIERLDASWRTGDSADLEAQVAAVWEMVGAMDPELAKVASQYA